MKNDPVRNNSGSFLVLLGAIAFSLGGLFIKLIPLNPITINSARCVFSSLIIGSYMYFSRHRLKINRTVIFGAIFVFLMLLCYVVSNKLTSAANAIVLEYTAPILVVIFEAVFFKKKPNTLTIIICLLVIIGIGIVVLDGIASGNFLGDMIALASGVFYALTMMLNDFDNSDSLSSVFLGHLFTALIGIPLFGSVLELKTETLLLIAALGIFQAGLGYTLLTVGLKRCEPVTGSLMACIEPVLNPILVAIFYKEYLNTKQLIGCMIVIVSIIIYNVYSSKSSKDKLS